MAQKRPPKLVEKYGLRWDENRFVHPAMIELALYANDKLRGKAGSKALSKSDHMREAIRAMIPEHVFSFNAWSNLIIDIFCDNDESTIWGSSSSGKSGTVAMIILADLMAAPTVTKTSLCTSPLKMHDDRSFGSLKKWHSYLPDELRLGKIVKAPAPGLITVDRDGQNAGVVCISTKDGESSEDLKSKIGAHQKRNRFVVDEPQKCSESVLSVKANFGASGEYKEIFLGNPSGWFDALGKHSIPHCLLPDDKEAIEKNDGKTELDIDAVEKNEPDIWLTTNKWRGNHGICIVLDGRKSPAMTDESLTYLAGKEHIDDLIHNYGDDSMQLWTYGIGRMPPSGLVETIISSKDFRQSGAADSPEKMVGNVREIAGLDPSGGRDGVRLCRIRIGTRRDGLVGVDLLNIHRIEVKISQGDISGQIAGQTARKLREWGIPVTRLAGDATGNMGGQMDRIEQELGEKGMHRVFFSGAATKRPVSISRHTAQDHYNDHATELLSNVGMIVSQGRFRGATDEFAHQITTRKVFQQKGRTKVEEKDDWRDRNQGSSPDDLDSVVCAVEMAIDKGWIKPFLRVHTPGAGRGFGNGTDRVPESAWEAAMMDAAAEEDRRRRTKKFGNPGGMSRLNRTARICRRG